MNITNNDLAEFTDNTEGMYKKMKRERPMQYEIMQLGGFCKKYDLSLNDLKNLANLKKDIKENIESNS